MPVAQTLLVVLLVVAAGHALPDLVRLRDFSWLRVWLSRWTRGDAASTSRVPIGLLPLLLVAACLLIQAALAHVMFGLPAFAFAAIVLFYCWGPRDLDADVEG